MIKEFINKKIQCYVSNVLKKIKCYHMIINYVLHHVVKIQKKIIMFGIIIVI